MLTFLIGGARSGKSRHAVEMGRAHEHDGGRVTYLATAPRIPGDHDFDRRIDRHRDERPEAWNTVEEPIDVIGVFDRHRDDLIIVDCLTLWVQNLRWRGDPEEAVLELASTAATAAAQRSAPTIVVSNEVGLGIHPATEDGREFRDVLGRVNQVWAATAHRTWFFVAGRVLELGSPEVRP